MIHIHNLHLSLPGFALKDISLDIAEGDFFALIGPTGAGKSLILEAMLGMLPMDSGRILLGNKDITAMAPEKRGLGIVYQDYALFPHLNVRKNILYGIKYHKLPTKEVAEHFDFLVHSLGIARLLHRYPDTLSGGERQRVALARALILKPSALLLDEPLSALDPVLTEEIKDLLRTIHRELSMTIIMVSHSFSDVFYLANKVAILKNGRIRQQGSVDEVFEQPNSRFTAGFVGMRNILRAGITTDQGIVDNLAITLPKGSNPQGKYLAIRPDDICPLRSGHNGFENTFSGTVTNIAHQGFYFDVWLTIEGVTFQAVWDKNFVLDHKIKPGKEMEIGFYAHKVRVLAQ